MSIERLKIKEEVEIGDLSDLIDGGGISLTNLLVELNVINYQHENVYLRRYFDDIEIIKIVERDETDKEYGKRIAKETGEYNRYLKLKEKFEGK